MARLPAPSLRFRLPLFMSALAAVGLLVVGAFAYTEVRNAARVSAESRLSLVAAEMVETLQAAVAVREGQDLALGESSAVQEALTGGPADTAALVDLLGGLAVSGSDSLPVRLLDREGRVVFSTGALPDPSLPDPDPSPPMEETRSYGPFREVGDDLLYWTSQPLPGDEGALGWLVQRRRIGSSSTAEALRDLIGGGIEIFLTLQGDSVWIDLEGQVRADHAGADTSGEARVQERESRGPVLSRILPIPDTPWLVAVEMPLERVQARPAAFLRSLLIASVLVVLVIVAVSWLVSRRITLPIASLTQAAEAVARGQYDRRVEPADRDDEIGRLGRAFNTMGDHIQRSDEALREKLREARTLADSLEEARSQAEAAREEAQAADRAKSEFLATMSHEIRTPINAVLGYAELMRLGIPDEPTPQQDEYLDRIERSSRLLESLVSDVLDFARLESGKLRVSDETGDLREAVRSALAALEPEARRKGVMLRGSWDDGGTAFRGDPQRVEQILLNLLSNAVKFTPAGGDVAISARPATAPPPGRDGPVPWRRVDVRDSGIGIDREDREAIFQPFRQVRGGFTREHGGTGLGLAISRKLTWMMGGELTMESEPGKGSTFTLWLPGSDGA